MTREFCCGQVSVIRADSCSRNVFDCKILCCTVKWLGEDPGAMICQDGFLSPAVLMHSGLLCIVFCLFVYTLTPRVFHSKILNWNSFLF